MKNLFVVRIVVILLFALMYGLVYIYLTNDKNQRVDQFLQQQISLMENNYAISNNRFEFASNNLFNAVINRPDILELLYEAKHTRDDRVRQQQLRDEMFTQLRPFYEQLLRVGIKIMLFTFDDNIVFLRVHKPTKFNDSIVGIRHGVTFVNGDQKIRRGFEQGKISHAFRNIFPLYYHDEYLGNVDISFSSEVIQENMTKLHGIDTHFILKKSLFDVKIWQSQNQVQYVPSIEHEDYLFALTPHQKNNAFADDKRQLVALLHDQIDENIARGDAFALYGDVDGKMMVITFLPVLNIKDAERVAYIVSYTHSHYLDTTLQDYLLVIWSVLVVFILLAYVIWNNLHQRHYLQLEVDAKTKDLQYLNENLQKEVERQLSEIRNKDSLLIDQSRMASMGEMIGNIAHQWRQPLNALGLIMQKLQIFQERGNLNPEKLKENLEKGIMLIEKMSTTIDDFRYYLEPARSKERFELKEILESTLSLVSGLFDEHNITIKMVVDPDIKIEGCKNEFSQVVLNILNNAKDAIEEKAIQQPTITIEAKMDRDKAVLTIRDNAGGIPPGVISKIFDPYFTTKEEGKGTGIGLFMSKRIIAEKMGGKLFVRNSEEGAEFTMILPLAS